MADDVPVQDWSILQVKLHPELAALLEAKARKTGRSPEAEAACLVGEAMEAAELPPAATNSPFRCSEDLMAEKAVCKDCGELTRRHAKIWAERHVQLTGHRVEVSLHLDLRDDDWLEKLTPGKRAELDAVRDGDVARALAQQLLGGTKH